VPGAGRSIWRAVCAPPSPTVRWTVFRRCQGPRLRAYRPLGDIAKLKVPVLMVDAGSENMFDIRENAGAVRDYLEREGRVPFLYRVIPGIDHYGIYFDGYAQSASLARNWFTTHLLDPGA
jgi:uncharacterized protein